MCCRTQAAADREWRAKEKAAAERKAAVQADLNEARARQAADRAAAAAAAAEAARRDAAAQLASAQHAMAAQERQVWAEYGSPCEWALGGSAPSQQTQSARKRLKSLSTLLLLLSATCLVIS